MARGGGGGYAKISSHRWPYPGKFGLISHFCRIGDDLHQHYTLHKLFWALLMARPLKKPDAPLIARKGEDFMRETKKQSMSSTNSVHPLISPMLLHQDMDLSHLAP
jgi:hypothetical protein